MYFLGLTIFSLNLFACATAFDSRGVYHRVRKEDDIWKIAKFYHISIQELAEWNNIESPKEVYPGLKLYIPRDSENAKKTSFKKKNIDNKVSKKADIKIEKGKFEWPVNGVISSGFGIRNGRRHDGVDIKAAKGTPIKAAAKGTVVYEGRLKGYGKLIILRHKDRFFTVYAHNSKNKVGKGQKVAKGDVVGYVGATGRATGPHVHFEIRQKDRARNPMFFLPATGGSQNYMIAVNKDTKKDSKNSNKKTFSRREKMMEALKVKDEKQSK